MPFNCSSANFALLCLLCYAPMLVCSWLPLDIQWMNRNTRRRVLHSLYVPIPTPSASPHPSHHTPSHPIPSLSYADRIRYICKNISYTDPPPSSPAQPTIKHTKRVRTVCIRLYSNLPKKKPDAGADADADAAAVAAPLPRRIIGGVT